MKNPNLKNVGSFALVIVLGTWLLLVSTTSSIPIVWDEGAYLFRADRIIAWFQLLFNFNNPIGWNVFSSKTIGEYWLFVNWGEGHPAGFAIPIAASKYLFSGLFDPLTASRIGPITIFSFATGAISFRLNESFGRIAGLFGPIMLITLPRMFSEAHFATQDGQLAAWWLMLWAVDSSSKRSRSVVVMVGILLGLACATKFTGWFAWFPLVISRTTKSNRSMAPELLVIVPVALFTFYLVNPPLWHAPVTNMIEHFRLALGRPDINFFSLNSVDLSEVWKKHHRSAIDFRHYFFGGMGSSEAELSGPFYSALGWLILATPVPTLFLGIIGFWRVIKVNLSNTLLLILSWAILLIVRSVPGAPVNDGIRLFLPSFGFWCVFAGIGAAYIWKITSSKILVRFLICSSIAGGVFNLWRYYPQNLSHYSALVGGVRGAARLGMEPTYWWDGLDNSVMDWLNNHTDKNASIAFSLYDDYNLDLLREWGRLQMKIVEPSWEIPFQWYVLQNRFSTLSSIDRELILSENPFYTKYAGSNNINVSADLDVPLVFIFSYEQFVRARRTQQLNAEDANR